VLVGLLAREALEVSLRPAVKRTKGGPTESLTKAYVAALAKVAAAVPLRLTNTIQDTEERAAAVGKFQGLRLGLRV